MGAEGEEKENTDRSLVRETPIKMMKRWRKKKWALEIVFFHGLTFCGGAPWGGGQMSPLAQAFAWVG